MHNRKCFKFSRKKTILSKFYIYTAEHSILNQHTSIRDINKIKKIQKILEKEEANSFQKQPVNIEVLLLKTILNTRQDNTRHRKNTNKAKFCSDFALPMTD